MVRHVGSTVIPWSFEGGGEFGGETGDEGLVETADGGGVRFLAGLGVDGDAEVRGLGDGLDCGDAGGVEVPLRVRAALLEIEADGADVLDGGGDAAQFTLEGVAELEAEAGTPGRAGSSFRTIG